MAVGGIAAVVVAAMALFTLVRPAQRAQRVVHAAGLAFQLSAAPDPAYQHGLTLRLTIDPPPPADASIDLTPSMPAMGSMAASVTNLRRVGPGAYEAEADLGMGGLWRVQATLHRPGEADVSASFRLNA